jgi:protein-tyrosine-phosphatase
MSEESVGAVIDAEMNTHLEAVVDQLVNVTGASIRRHELRALVDDCYRTVAKNARVTTFLPLLTERYALARLRHRRVAAGAVPKEIPEILVIDRHNSARSQSAAALLRFYAPGRFEVTSAGVEPGEQVDFRVVGMLRDRGVELTDFPKPLTGDAMAAADHVIVINHNPLPIPDAPAAVVARWDVTDPRDMDDSRLCEQLADIDVKVRAVLAEIDPEHTLHDPVFR